MEVITSILPILEEGIQYRITSPFGMREDPFGVSAPSMHYGVDMTLWCGWAALAWVCAAWDGKVIRSDYDASRGNYVIIDHGEGLRTVYMHLADNTVKAAAGERVTAGQRLGYMGATGGVTGAHLHFQMEMDGVPIDPMPYITGEVPEADGEGASDVVSGEESVLDNTPADWAREAVQWAAENGILYGDENGNYRLHEPCTREMMLVFLHRAMGGGK